MILLFCALIFILGVPANAQTPSCKDIKLSFPLNEICLPGRSCKDGQLYLLKKNVKLENREWVPLNSEKEIEFGTPRRRFFKYIVKGNKRDNVDGGVIHVKTIRKYDPDNGIRPILAERVVLYRNKFPKKKDKFNDDVDLKRYEDYHKNGIGLPDSLARYHVGFPINERTRKPPIRRMSFAFNPDVIDKYTVRRSMLLYYGNAKDIGSEITFCVGMQNVFISVDILVSDIGSSSPGGYTPQSWRINKKK